MFFAELLLVQRIRYDALELAAEGVGHEFLDVHDGHVVLRAFFESCSFGDVFHTAKLGKMVWGGKDGKLRGNLGRVSTSFDKILYICNRKT